ncbi:MAG TPA: AAA family ATPase, partial [Ktedonobacterales bacterium]|nr:AAA family ATPase [Ktedonobacterales bacterium]
MTQAALAERAGYSVSHISKLESSARLPISATIELLADALTLNPAERGALERAARRNGQLPQVPPHALSRPLLPLVGRDHEIACIERHLVAEAEPPLLLFAGESGIGKTRLLQAAVERGASSGWRVLEGVCRRHSMQGPYGPLLDALAGAIRPLDRTQLQAALDGCMWLVRLMPELAERGAVPMPAWSLPAGQERRLMFAAVERFLRNIAGPAGTLLVLDDLQWARADTLDALSALVERAPQSPLRIIGAYRHNDGCPGNDLTTLFADLAREGLVVREEMEPLSPLASAELLDTLLSDTDDVSEHIRAEVLRLAGGMPFVLVSYAQWLRSHTGQKGSALLELDIPWDVTQTVEQRIMVLSEAAQLVIHIAAVSDGDDPRELLVRVARQLGYDEPDAIAALDAACEAGVLVHQGDDTYAFTYDLIQEVVERRMGAAQHAYLHREIATALEGQHSRPRVEALAEHYEQAGEPEKAVIYLERAGAHAKALHAYTDAERLYRTAAEQMDSLARRREAAHARKQLGIMLGYLGRYEDALVELDAALNSYRNEGWTDGQIQVAAQIGRVYYAQGEIERGITRLEHEAATADGASDRGLAALHLSLATLYAAAGRYGRELEVANYAAELAHRASDRHLLALAELERGTALAMLDRLGDGVRALEDAAIPLTRATGDLWTEALALDGAARTRILCGEFAEARADIERGLQLAWRLDDELVAACMTLNRGVLRFYTGAWRQAQADLRWSCAALQQGRLPSRAAHALVWLGQLSLAKG